MRPASVPSSHPGALPFSAILVALGSILPGMAGDADWGHYLGDKASSQYSTLDQITPDNAAHLEVAWTFHCGDIGENNRSQIQCNPLVVDGILYGTSPTLNLFALDAAKGERLWEFDPRSVGSRVSGVNRGVVFWKSGDGTGARILYATGNHLHAVDARTGKLIADFGESGRVNLFDNLSPDARRLGMQVTTPGVLFGESLILGMRLGEGPAPAAPGPVRAYNVRTGELIWRFNTIPLPGEPGYETWPPDAYKHIGGANVWSGFALDEERGLVFCPTGSAAFDFWGGNRIGQNLYANCLLALDAATGKRVWHYQFVHHDLWDRDLPAAPNLLTVTHDGKRIDAVAQVTKSGHVFVFNRETGDPLFPMEEIAVPPSDLQGESAWPTQSLPTKPAPFARQVFGYDQITDISPESRRAVLDQFVKLRPHTPFMPPSTEGTIIFPGFDGGGEWGGAAASPDGVLYVNGNEMPWILTMVESRRDTGATTSSGKAIYTQICAACHGVDRKGNTAQNVADLTDVAARLKMADVLAVLEAGKGVMPSFAFLSDSQRKAVAAYLLGLDEADAAAEDATVFDAAPYAHTGYNRFFDPEGYPAVKPPWGTLNAIDLNTGEYLWSTRLGEFAELTARGIPKTGTENYGGPIVTAGGVLFIGASKDGYFRAHDRATGKELWKYPLPAGGYATPATYAIDDKQYVVIACGGGKMGTPSGDAYIAFKLPD
ncbi:MAG: PQQ-binding-like beta-propeller repeat protein [Verrucomicrobiae bacterium]|nr:PQQ-binding-like beta-propeller repeat protein [Verrucomicrobiae bacterium]